MLESKARFRWLAAGRRWRKTTLAVTVASESAATRRQHVLWAAPTFDQCRIGWGEMQKACGEVAVFHQGRMEVLMPGGGAVLFRSLDDPDHARGHTADGVIIDEAGFVQGRAWTDVLRPMLSDTGGWALIMGTPKGRNWFWREHLAAKDREDAASWQVPTLGVRIVEERLERAPHGMENGDFPFSEAVQMFQTMPRRTFEQEFLAEFVEDAGLVFRGVAAVSTLSPGRPQRGHRYVFGVDWAKSTDWTVISVLDATTREQVALDRFNRIDYRFQVQRLKAMAERWRPDTIMAEANAMGVPLAEQLQREGLPVCAFTTTNASKAMIIEALSLAIEKGEIRLLGEEAQSAELQAYDMQRLPSGLYTYGAPEGMHDDLVMALALAWNAMGFHEVAVVQHGALELW